ncbi:hypothetical protein C4588_05705 [Candidatus Parcubacteria bacterium]|nr:MAG: hypothetical protein C4588_05705 [Candidatus Parcubacteria bacterium]
METPENRLESIQNLEIGTIVRTNNAGAYKVSGSPAWGKFLAKCADPEGTHVPKKLIESFHLKEGFPRIPAVQWSSYISLCFYMSPPNSKKLSKYDHDSQYEVSVCLLRDKETLTKWKIVVPLQKVSGLRVDANLSKCIDLETGEEYDQFPPQGWLHAGTSHSHNTMPAFFSSIDDESELTVPGVHIVVGGIDHKAAEYTYEASVVLQRQRRELDLSQIVDTTPVEAVFNEKALDYIKLVLEAPKKVFGPSKSDWLSRAITVDVPDPYGLDDEYSLNIESDLIDALETSNDAKIDSFFRGLDRNNSDLFDDLEEEIDITSLPRHVRQALVEEARLALLNGLPVDPKLLELDEENELEV